jgi:hypothetical protein
LDSPLTTIGRATNTNNRIKPGCMQKLIRILWLISLCSTVPFIPVHAQNQEIDPTNTLNYYQIEQNRLNFFHVNDRYQIQKDTIYYIDRAEFIINLGWDSIQINNDWYIILTYPNYKSGKQAPPSYLRMAPPLDVSAVQQEVTMYALKAATNSKRTSANNSGDNKLADSVTKLNLVLKNLETRIDSITKADTVAKRVLQEEIDSISKINKDLSKSLNVLDGDTSTWFRMPLNGINGMKLMIKKNDFQKLTLIPIYSTAWKRVSFSSGQLTIPFKLRFKTGGQQFSMTTDVTLGAYAGIKKRISKRQNYYLTLPIVAGLTFINVNNNTTSTTSSTTSGVYPGWTLASGLIVQLNSFNIGVITGWDFASQVGNTWIYQGKEWVSFGIGYSFLK